MINEPFTGITTNEYTIGKRITEGSIKKIYLAQKGNKEFILKIFRPNKKGIGLISLIGGSIEKEIEKESKVTDSICREFNLKNVNGMIENFFSSELGSYVAVENICSEGSFLNFKPQIKEGIKLQEEEAESYLFQILNGINEMRYFGLDFHGDIKFPNIVVDGKEKPVLKLVDFGMAGTYEPGNYKQYVNAGYPATSAPELILTCKQPSYLTELWSLSMLGYKMVSGEYLTGFVEPSEWIDMKLEDRMKFYDAKIKHDTLNLGQIGIDEKIKKLGLKNKRVENLIVGGLRVNADERFLRSKPSKIEYY